MSKLILHLKYASVWGETVWVCGNIPALGNNLEAGALPLQFIDKESWEATVSFEKGKEAIEYYYFIQEQNGTKKYHAIPQTFFPDTLKNDFFIKNTWYSQSNGNTVFFTKPFAEIYHKIAKVSAGSTLKDTTHIFKVKAPVLQAHETIGIIGSIPKLGNWSANGIQLMKKGIEEYSIHLHLPIADHHIVYKYAVFNTKTKTLVRYENGENRILSYPRKSKEQVIVHDNTIQLDYPFWKGAGVAIPVFSLRSKNSFGVGEFNDIKLLGNWAHKAGLKLIQLLPINDTIIDKTNADSYPYAANSSFALHPMYINLQEVGELPKEHKLSVQYLRKQRKFNKEAALDYENVIRFKLAYLKELYLQDQSFLSSADFEIFFSKNSHWLLPYAMYCFLRDKHKTTDFGKWGKYKSISFEKVVAFTAPDQKNYPEIAFWFFVQYHLHLQLTAAIAHVHSLGIAMKGDIPIGIGRTSCDAWQYPHLFHMDKQAGAPPDDFAVKGQNWGFPTYNWEAMQKDSFLWWKLRFEKMSDYFDAFRIDHILGFFRIWSIPMHAVEGIMGNFVPAIPVYTEELQQQDIHLGYDRLCKPYLTTDYLQQVFAGENTDAILQHFFTQQDNGTFALQPDYDTQVKVTTYFKSQQLFPASIQYILLDCLSNVLFFEEKDSNGIQFHFNIAMEKTYSFRQLDWVLQQRLKKLYINYFYERQEEFWKIEAQKKIPGIQHSTNMLMCGEDLGMVPNCVPGVMQDLSILSLEVQRMPKAVHADFVDLHQVPYLSVVTPSTHDMSTIRGWWEEDRTLTQKFYNQRLQHFGEAPHFCEPWIVKQILQQHLQSKAMLSIFQLQDLMSMQPNLRRENPNEERINQPANPSHYWCYRMHVKLEDLIKDKVFTTALKEIIEESGR